VVLEWILAVDPLDLGRRLFRETTASDRARIGSAVPGRLCGPANCVVCDATLEHCDAARPVCFDYGLATTDGRRRLKEIG
jgi:hypothetical protein